MPTKIDANVPWLVNETTGVIAGYIANDGSEKTAALSSAVDVRAYGAKFDGVTDDTVAIQAAIDAAHAAGGGCVMMPAGVGILATGLVLTGKDKVVLRGQGIGVTVLKGTSTTQTGLITKAVAIGTEAEYMGFEDFTLYGPHEASPSLLTSARGFAVHSVKRLWFRNLEVKYTKEMGLTSTYSFDVHVEGCRLEYIARDAINLTSCLRTTVVNNRIRFCADDAIAIHTTSAQGNPPAEGHVIANNSIEDSYGIKMLGCVKASITGNVGRRLKGYGVWFADESAEGNNDLLAVTIAGNTFTDIINGDEFGGGSVICGIRVCSSVTSFQAPVVGGGSPDYNYPEDFSYLSNAANQNAGGQGINIVGNTIYGFTLPAVATYSTWGFGQAWISTGFTNPDLSSGFERACLGIRLGGALLTVRVQNNHLEGLSSGVFLESDATYLGLLECSGNTIRRFANYGVALETSGQKYGIARIRNNFIDGDPYFEHSARVATGKWTAGNTPSGIDAINFKAVEVVSNSFRNVNSTCREDATTLTQHISNIYYMEPAAAWDGVGASWTDVTDNRGINYPDGIGDPGSRVVWENSDPTSATYGQILGTQWNLVANTIPTAGYYVIGQFVRNGAAHAGASTITLGWQRLTNGNAHVSGTDWRVIQATTP